MRRSANPAYNSPTSTILGLVREISSIMAEGYEDKDSRYAKLEAIFSRHASLPFDDDSAALAGRVRKQLERRGKVIGPHDLQIAAIALQHQWSLVTGNKDEFSQSRACKSRTGGPVACERFVALLTIATHQFPALRISPWIRFSVVHEVIVTATGRGQMSQGMPGKSS